MDSTRLPRFQRHPNIGPIHLTDRDRQIIRWLFYYRFLNSRQFLDLAGGSRQQLLRRVQLLYHHGYLERPRAQIDYYVHGGSRAMVYGLGNQGAVLLKGEEDFPFCRADWSAKNGGIKRLFLEHALLVSEVMVAFELACRRNDSVRLLAGNEVLNSGDTRGNREPFQWSVAARGQEDLSVRPDRVFGLEYRAQATDHNRVAFFLEADRGTMPVTRRSLDQSSFLRKLLAYEATWAQNLHRSRWGIQRFRVLTVTSSAERLQHLVAACQQLEHGHGLFLFTDDASLAAHGDILTLPWQTTRPGKTETLT